MGNIQQNFNKKNSENSKNEIFDIYGTKDISNKNPGTCEDLHKEFKDILPNIFVGACFTWQKWLSEHLQISHNLNLHPATVNNCYRFRAFYLGDKEENLEEYKTVLFGEIERSGNLTANILQKITSNIDMKFVTEYKGNSIIFSQLITNYKGKNFTISTGIADIDFKKNSGLVFGQYFQSINNCLSIGLETGIMYKKSLYKEWETAFNFITRYQSNNNIISSNLSKNEFHVSLYNDINSQLKCGGEIIANYQTKFVTAKIGYQMDIENGKFIFRSSLDSNWNICSVLEKKLETIPCVFTLSALLNHKTNDFKIGYGFIFC